MNFQQIADAQWGDYADRHRNPKNLLIHIVAVPLFWVAAFEVLGALLLLLMGVPLAFRMLFWAAALMGISLAAQAIGRSFENSAPRPMGDALEFARRTLVEQFFTFPRFVISGGWLRNLRGG
jgi:hypothetical protein